MENVNKLMTIGFGVILFSTAVAMCLMMYKSVDNIIHETQNSISARRVLEVRQLE